jgi:hypothetical protein
MAQGGYGGWEEVNISSLSGNEYIEKLEIFCRCVEYIRGRS